MKRLASIVLICALGAFAGPATAQQTTEPNAKAAEEAAKFFAVAERYRTGQGVLQSYSKAAEWYRRAAEQGDARAMHQLGRQMIAGLGVLADPEQGFRLIEYASQTGDADILLDLGNAYLTGVVGAKDPSRAAEILALAADRGSDEAAVALALLFQEGDGVEKNIERAIALYLGPAERGSAQAQNNLGLIYARGTDVRQDYSKAMEWFTKAAEQNLPAGLRNLAALHQNGFGTPHNETLANELLRRAAEGGGKAVFLQTDPRIKPVTTDQLDAYFDAAALGDPIANLMVGLVLSERSGGSDMKDLRAAAQAFETAAKRGVPAAMANLGMLMFEGRGLLQDYVDGYAWLTVAASMGQPQALKVRDGLSSVMTIKQINAAQQRAEVLWAQTTGRAP